MQYETKSGRNWKDVKGIEGHGKALTARVCTAFARAWNFSSDFTSRLGLDNVAIVTLEQIAPFPFDRVKASRLEMFFFCAVSGGFGSTLV